MKKIILLSLFIFSQLTYAQSFDPNARAKAELQMMLNTVNNQVAHQMANGMSESMRQALQGSMNNQQQLPNQQQQPIIPVSPQFNTPAVISVSQTNPSSQANTKETIKKVGQTPIVIKMKELKIQDYNQTTLYEGSELGKEQDEENYIKFLTGQLR